MSDPTLNRERNASEAQTILDHHVRLRLQSGQSMADILASEDYQNLRNRLFRIVEEKYKTDKDRQIAQEGHQRKLEEIDAQIRLKEAELRLAQGSGEHKAVKNGTFSTLKAAIITAITGLVITAAALAKDWLESFFDSVKPDSKQEEGKK